MLAKVTSKNQLTLPKAITAAVGEAECYGVEVRDGQIVLTPVRIQRGVAVGAKLAALRRHFGWCSTPTCSFPPCCFRAAAWAGCRSPGKPASSFPRRGRPRCRHSFAYLRIRGSDSTVPRSASSWPTICPGPRSATCPILPPLVPKCRDKHDLPFLHLATAGTRVLLSADADLLALAGGAKSAIRFDIVAPVHFMRRVGLITV